MCGFCCWLGAKSVFPKGDCHNNDTSVFDTEPCRSGAFSPTLGFLSWAEHEWGCRVPTACDKKSRVAAAHYSRDDDAAHGIALNRPSVQQSTLMCLRLDDQQALCEAATAENVTKVMHYDFDTQLHMSSKMDRRHMENIP